VTYTPTYTDPAYDPATWSLGYQQRTFGLAADPSATGTGPELPGSIYSALANPPDNMTTAIEMAIPTAPVIAPTE
jgi:hypothetical protein